MPSYQIEDEFGKPKYVHGVCWMDTREPPRFMLCIDCKGQEPLIVHRDRLTRLQ